MSWRSTGREGLRQLFGDLWEWIAEVCSVPVTRSCRTGVCHNCESSLIEGRLRYLPSHLIRHQRASRTPLSDVILDL
jgi:hypothetical protein